MTVTSWSETEGRAESKLQWIQLLRVVPECLALSVFTSQDFGARKLKNFVIFKSTVDESVLLN